MPTDDHDKNLSKLFWRGFIIALALGVAAGILIGLLANSHANRVGNCVNDTLGKRNAPTAADARAHIADAEALQRFLAALSNPSEAARRKAFRTFIVAQDKYVRVLVHDQQLRAKTPLGKC